MTFIFGGIDRGLEPIARSERSGESGSKHCHAVSLGNLAVRGKFPFSAFFHAVTICDTSPSIKNLKTLSVLRLLLCPFL
jgi:hypothetical protein